jgi:flagellar biosynthesis protein FlhG
MSVADGLTGSAALHYNTAQPIFYDQAEGLRRMTQNRPVRVIAVSSGKGGVGKTNISVNLAMSLAASGQKVLIMDADLGLANIDVLLGLHPKLNISHVLSGDYDLSEIIVDAPGGIQIIPAASGISNMAGLTDAENAGIINAFGELENDLDVLIIDTAAGIDKSVVSFCRASQEVIVVVCDEPSSITDAYALIKVLNKEQGINRFRILANMAHDMKEGRVLFSKILKVTDRFLDVSLDFLGAIPFDIYLRKAVKKQTAVTQAYPRSPSAQAFNMAAQKISKWPMPKRPGGHLEFFVERLINANQS